MPEKNNMEKGKKRQVSKKWNKGRTADKNEQPLQPVPDRQDEENKGSQQDKHEPANIRIFLLPLPP
jgi:hypothetical protein